MVICLPVVYKFAHIMAGMLRDDRSGDPELLARLRAGDAAAFDAIYLRYYARLAIFAERLAGGVEPAADIVQDVFLSVWERRAHHRIVPPIAAYLYGAVRNRVISARRQAATAERHRANVVELPQAPTGSDPEERLEASNVRAALLLAIGTLPERQQLALRLYSFERLEPDAIADLLHISERAARKLLTKALAKLSAVIDRAEG